MREVIFRGKRLDNGKWVHGLYIHHRNVAHYIIDARLGGYEDMNGEFFTPRWYAIDPATVGQYTGLTDKTGKRIFEGDIVNGLFLFERPIAGVVTFRDGSFGVQWMRGRVEEFSAFTSCCNVAWAVIGNIADNPELLEGGVDDG